MKQEYYPTLVLPTKGYLRSYGRLHTRMVSLDNTIIWCWSYCEDRIYQNLPNSITLWKNTNKKISELATIQFQKMGMDMGKILEPITPLYSGKWIKPWNGIIKVYLRNPATDGQALLTRTWVFSLTLNYEIKIPKFAKGYNSLAPYDLLRVTISSPNLCCLPQYKKILTEIA